MVARARAAAEARSEASSLVPAAPRSYRRTSRALSGHRVLIEEGPYFSGKPRARAAIWARFPGQRPGAPLFRGLDRAAERLLPAPPLKHARVVLADPDPAIRPLRRLLRARGVVVLVPARDLRRGLRDASTRRRVPLVEARVDALVLSAVAVTRDGYHCGSGAGRMDLLFALLRERGHPPVPACTLVHPDQIVRYFPAYEHDVPLSAIATPDELIEVPFPAPAPRGVDRRRLSAEALEAMPELLELLARG